MRELRKSRLVIDRHGAVAVEFALVTPLLLTVVLGMLELGRAFEAQQMLATVVRDAARFGAMDKEGIVAEGETTAQKIEDDIRSFLNAGGLPGDVANITITHLDNPSQAFIFEDPNNDLALYQVSAEFPYSLVSIVPEKFLLGDNLRAKVVFRNGRTSVQ